MRLRTGARARVRVRVARRYCTLDRIGAERRGADRIREKVFWIRSDQTSARAARRGSARRVRRRTVDGLVALKRVAEGHLERVEHKVRKEEHEERDAHRERQHRRPLLVALHMRRAAALFALVLSSGAHILMLMLMIMLMLMLFIMLMRMSGARARDRVIATVIIARIRVRVDGRRCARAVRPEERRCGTGRFLGRQRRSHWQPELGLRAGIVCIRIRGCFKVRRFRLRSSGPRAEQ